MATRIHSRQLNNFLPGIRGNDQLARKLRRLAEQLIEAADGNTNTHEAPEEHTIGIAVEKPVELNLVSPKIIETARD